MFSGASLTEELRVNHLNQVMFSGGGSTLSGVEAFYLENEAKYQSDNTVLCKVHSRTEAEL
jgi:hypothetical protein